MQDIYEPIHLVNVQSLKLVFVHLHPRHLPNISIGIKHSLHTVHEMEAQRGDRIAETTQRISVKFGIKSLC
jgi:uncharacterized protein (UPF0210 family)